MKKKRIVIKIGSSSLTNDRGEIDHAKITDHVHALASVRQAGHEVILVSSGAVAAGFLKLGYPSRPVTTKGKQAAAAVGQSLLIQSYTEKFAAYDIVPAQLLLTRDDFSNRERYKNAFETINELLNREILPIINENDTVAVEELTFGDNDTLSALVSGFLHADHLLILTDIDGVYDSNPHTNPDAKRYNFVETITDQMILETDETGSKFGTGGMRSKLEAAKVAQSLGVATFIGTGHGPTKLLDILNGTGKGTYISHFKNHWVNTNKQWIALHSESVAILYVDQGAEDAILYQGRSLLPAGIFKIDGSFQTGDVVEVYGLHGLLGRGEVNYSSDTLKKVLLNRSEDSHHEERSVEVIHRDRWVEFFT